MSTYRRAYTRTRRRVGPVTIRSVLAVSFLKAVLVVVVLAGGLALIEALF